MSIELVLQKFPKDIKLKEGFKCRSRPLRRDDETAFHEFFLSVPAEERMFIKHRVTEPEVIKDWCKNIDLGRNLPMLAFTEGKIIGCGTLHQELGGWKRHIGRVSVLVHPQYRARGTGAGAGDGDFGDCPRAWGWKRWRRNSSASRRRPSRCSRCWDSAI